LQKLRALCPEFALGLVCLEHPHPKPQAARRPQAAQIPIIGEGPVKKK
jgi:hypothetical protein